MSHHKNTQQIHNIMITSKVFENVIKLKHFHMTATNPNCLHKKKNEEHI